MKYTISKELKEFAQKLVFPGRKFEFFEVENLYRDEDKVLGMFKGDWTIHIENNSNKSKEFMDLVFLHELSHSILLQVCQEANTEHNANLLAIVFARLLNLPIDKEFLQKTEIKNPLFEQLLKDRKIIC